MVRKLSSSSSFSENTPRDPEEMSDRTSTSDNRRSLTDAIGEIFTAPRKSALSFPKLGSWRRGNGNKYAENGDLDYLSQNSDNLNFSTDAMDLAAAHGHLEVLQWLHVHRTEGCTTQAFDKAATNGHMHVVTWLHLNRLEGGTVAAMDGAAANGHLDILKFLHKHRQGKEGCTAMAMDMAATNGHLAAVVWLNFNRSEGCSTAAMDGAALGGHMEILNFLHDNRKEGLGNVSAILAALVKKGDLDTFAWVANHACEDLQFFAAMDFAVAENEIDVLRWVHETKHGFCSKPKKKTSAQIHDFLLATHSHYWDAPFPIDYAASQGFLLFVEYLHNTQAEHLASEMAINLAATNGFLHVVEFLHEARVEGCTTVAMDGAATNGHLDIVKFLHANRPEGCTVKAMDMAADYGHLEIVEWLYENRAERCSQYALNAAASSGHDAVVRFLCDKKLGEPFLAIDFAVQNGHLDVVTYLHETCGAMCEKAIFDMCSHQPTREYLESTKHAAYWEMAPLDFAAGEDRPDLIEWFVKTGHSTYTTSAMDRAAANGFLHVVSHLYETRTEGCTTEAMDYASANGHLAILQLLHGYYGNHYTTLALDLAAGNGHLEILTWFDSLQNTTVTPTTNAMDWAARNGHLDVLEYLHGISAECSKKAIDLAAKMGHVDVVMWLHETRGLKASPVTMEAAASGGHLAIVIYLSRKFPSVAWSAKTVDVALKGGHVDVAEWCVAEGFPCSSSTKDLAAKKGSLTLLTHFLPLETDPVPYLCDGLEAATTHGHLPLVEYIHATHHLYVLRKPYKKALKSKHSAVCAYLEGSHGTFWTQNPVDVAVAQRNMSWARWLLTKKKEMATSAAMDEAAANGQFEMVQFLHENDCTCTTNAMDAAAALGRLDMVAWFHENRTEGCTTDAMDLASQHGHFDVMKWLHMHREEGCTAYALNICAVTGRLDILQWLSEIISVYTKTTSRVESFDEFDPDLDPSEMEALQQQQQSLPQTQPPLLRRPTDGSLLPPSPKEASHHKLKSDSTDMMDLACENGHLEMVQWLTEHTKMMASVDAMNKAAMNGHLAIVEFLHVHRREGCTRRAMDWAAANGHLHVVQFLHFNRTEGCSTRAMDLAAKHGHLEVLQWLYHNREEGCTMAAIEEATKRGHTEVVQWLYSECTEEGSVLHVVDLAVANGHAALVAWLTDAKGEQWSDAAVQVARQRNHTAVLEYIESWL
ncbi:Aste57867_19094 [Aphanomyces stellatus]|uniref:Aste57867_19094 protein n=1 Tax=Aphanomyces stellatus TaxID=120398 RepID=A0A485LBZ1_9STRA|nr:hypothetical protein As57867_019030 [Aphanomyces stellatus]VFT95819.1 Aste57867_19094 [Aphanomyces stellatus]